MKASFPEKKVLNFEEIVVCFKKINNDNNENKDQNKCSVKLLIIWRFSMSSYYLLD